MKRKLLWCVVAIAALTIISYLALRSDADKVSAESEPGKHERFEQLNREILKRNETLRAELSAQSLDPSITDDVALGLVLRFVSGNQDEQQKTQVRQYMSDILGVKNTTDQDHFFTVGEAYKLESNRIQMQSEATTQKYHPSHSSITHHDRVTLKRLAQDKKDLIKESKRTLRQSISGTAWDSIETALITRIKPRIRASHHE